MELPAQNAMTTTFERLSAILVKDYKLAPEALVPEATLESLGIDSLAAAELLFSAEDVFRIAFPPEPVPLPTLGDVAAYIEGLIAQQHAGEAAARPDAHGGRGPARP
jgi:acyl carrier protein